MGKSKKKVNDGEINEHQTSKNHTLNINWYFSPTFAPLYAAHQRNISFTEGTQKSGDYHTPKTRR